MILQVNNEWRIISETEQWVAQRFHVPKEGKNVGVGYWKSEAYFTRPDQAAFWLVHRGVRDLPGTYPAADGLEVLANALHAMGQDIKRIADQLEAR